MKISELPEDIRIIAEIRRSESDWISYSNDLDDQFSFEGTPEGKEIWQKVNEGEFRPIREFHNKLKLDLNIPIDGNL